MAVPGEKRGSKGSGNPYLDSLKEERELEAEWDRSVDRQGELIEKRREAKKRGDMERVRELTDEIVQIVRDRGRMGKIGTESGGPEHDGNGEKKS